MDISKYKEQLQETVIAPMMEFMEECDDVDECGYSESAVSECEELISEYLDELGDLDDPTDGEIMELVRMVVMGINELCEKTDYCMIDTMEREAIWEIIQNSAVECGLSDPSDDITEEWRDW